MWIGRLRRRRREEFARLADRSRDGGPVTGGGELNRLAGIAAALGTLSKLLERQPQPRYGFRGSLRRRLVAAAARPSAIHPTPTPSADRRGGTHRAPQGHQDHRRVAVGVAMFTLATVAAVSTVSTVGALPGDPFYGVKRTAQSTLTLVATTERARGHRNLDLAAVRLTEVSRLLERDRAYAEPAIMAALRDMDARTRAGSAALTRAYRRSHDIRPLNLIDAFARDQRVRLATLLPALPGQTRLRARDSLRLVETVGGHAVTLLARSCRSTSSCA